jgi:hypothetical protein
MGYIQLAIIAALAVFALKSCNDVKRATQQRVTAEFEKQIAESVADSNKDAAQETARILALRPARQVEIAKAQAKRKVSDAKQKTVDPAYRTWADQPVPAYVVNSLRDSASASGGLYLAPSDREPGALVQPNNSAPIKADAKPGTPRLRLGPARPN